MLSIIALTWSNSVMSDKLTEKYTLRDTTSGFDYKTFGTYPVGKAPNILQRLNR